MFAGGEETSAEVLIVAPLVLDDIDVGETRARDVLGGSGAYAALAARYFAPTTLASVVGSDFPREHLDLLAGVRARIARVPGPSFRWHGAHDSDGTTRTLRNEPGATGGVVPPLGGADGAFVLVGAYPPALQRRIRERLGRARFVAVDTMAIHIAAEGEALRALLAEVDAAFLTADEARLLGTSGPAAPWSNSHEIPRASARANSTTALVVVKRGGAGAIVRYRDAELHVAAFPAREKEAARPRRCRGAARLLGEALPPGRPSFEQDPTGAGDAFAGAFLATIAAYEGRLDDDVLRLAGARGAAAASFAIEDLGTRALAAATREAIEERASVVSRAVAPS